MIDLERQVLDLAAGVAELRAQIAELGGQRRCAHCQTLYQPRRADQRYCAQACTAAAYRRRRRIQDWDRVIAGLG